MVSKMSFKGITKDQTVNTAKLMSSVHKTSEKAFLVYNFIDPGVTITIVAIY